MVVSGRLSAALRPAGLTAAAVFTVYMLLAEAIAALPIAALLEEPLSKPRAGGWLWRALEELTTALMLAALGRVNDDSAVKIQPPARGTVGRKRRTPTSVVLAAARLAVLVAAAQLGLAAAQAAGCPVEHD